MRRNRQTGVMSSNPAAKLSVMADHLERYFEEVGDFLPQYHDRTDERGSSGDAEMLNALVESERALRIAARALRKASKLAGGRP